MVKLCPLSRLWRTHEACSCQEVLCAWWHRTAEECSILVLATEAQYHLDLADLEEPAP